MLKPEKVLTGKFGMVPDFPLHFHILPLHVWISEAFAAAKPFHALQALNPEGYPATPDAAELIGFVWREYCFTGHQGVAFNPSSVADQLQSDIETHS